MSIEPGSIRQPGMAEALEYYAGPGPLSDLGAHAAELPAGIPDLCRVVQGLVVHPSWATSRSSRKSRAGACRRP
jgi:hypothetical protein